MAKLVYAADDDKQLLDLLEGNLKAEGYDVRPFLRGTELLDALKQEAPDIVLLDWMMPEMDGLEVCRRIRRGTAARNVPVIMLTARDNEIDMVIGLESGADDYITKPFSMRELTTRMRAIFRRIDGLRNEGASEIEAGSLRLDISGRRVWKDGREIALTLKEFELLKLLMQSRGRALTREYLLETIWGADYDGGTRTVDVHVMQLRKRLSLENEIETMRGIGYRFIEEQGGD